MVVLAAPCKNRIFGINQMTKSTLSRWLMRGAFTLAAVAAVSVLPAEQANAQFYGGSRGFSSGSYGRGGGISLSVGNVGLNYGYGGGYGGGAYRSVYRSPAVNYYRPSYGGAYRGGNYRGGSYRGGGGYGRRY